MQVLNYALRKEATLFNAVHIGPRSGGNTEATVDGGFARIVGGQYQSVIVPVFREQMGQVTNRRLHAFSDICPILHTERGGSCGVSTDPNRLRPFAPKRADRTYFRPI